MIKRHRTGDLGFTLLELMIVIAIVGILAATAVPSMIHYMAKAKSTEAITQLEKMYNGARIYWLEPHGAAGAITPLPPQFPASTPGPTPGISCCASNGGRCLPSQAQWRDPTWVGLAFSLDDPFYYQYQFISSANEFTARAIGNLDCDAEFSSFSMIGRVDSVNGVFGLAAVNRVNELE
jgi:prepilin-type N-terminal cleavage/methylation domain-containing protein